MAKKIIYFLLFALSFLLVYAVLSRSFDVDLGWHLRFGQSFWQSGRFPYADTGTWTYFGREWVNHEWGGDLLAWPIYAAFGYLPLVFITAFALWSSFLIILHVFRQKISAPALAAVIFCIWAVENVAVVRLTMIMPLFLALLIWHLENLPSKKWVKYALPVLLWAWSWIHGSWILGFIVIACYILGNAALLYSKKLRRYFSPPRWNKKDAIRAGGSGLAGAFLIFINPYGYKLYAEVLQYFSLDYYKTKIVEWLPSFAAPVSARNLLLMAVFAAAGLLFLRRRRRPYLPHLLLALGFFCAALMYKRQIILVALLSAPLLAKIFNCAADFVYNKFFAAEPKSFLYRYCAASCILSLSLGALLILDQSRWPLDIWSETGNLGRIGMPVEAVKFLQKNIPPGPARFFNEFSWGGYLSWQLPQALLFLDGRGPATWMQPGATSTLLEQYIGLSQNPARADCFPASFSIDYVILAAPQEKNTALGRLRLYAAHPSPLIDCLQSSPRWAKIYADDMALVWKRSPAR